MFRNAIIFAVFLLPAVFGANKADAFHDGGVGNCNGCHSMHGSGVTRSGPWLTKGSDPSSICLNCHSGTGSDKSYYISSADGSAMTPGGDFYWLMKSFVWTDGISPDMRHGHNIIALDYGYFQDPDRQQAPGGSYSSAYLGCNSCHDPHGKVRGTQGPISGSGSYGGSPPSGTIYGNYRLLGGAGYSGGRQAMGYSFLYDAPVAVQNPLVKYGESDTSHVDYGDGMSEWCANCHAGLYTTEHTSATAFKHKVVGSLEDEVINRYNQYVRTGDLSGNQLTAYLQFVPFERGTRNTLLLNPASTQGPDTNSRFMCLTCHRAHASAFVFSGRWDLKAVTISESHPRPGDAGVTGNDVLNAYYGRDILTEFGSGQKAFCDKCHDIPR